MHFEITKEQLQEVLNYLAAQRYIDVHNLVNMLTQGLKKIEDNPMVETKEK